MHITDVPMVIWNYNKPNLKNILLVIKMVIFYRTEFASDKMRESKSFKWEWEVTILVKVYEEYKIAIFPNWYSIVERRM